MFATRWTVLLAVVALIGFVVLSAARPGDARGPEATYVVQPGDTLWALATERYAGDPREAVWRIEQANGFDGGVLVPGTVLKLP